MNCEALFQTATLTQSGMHETDNGELIDDANRFDGDKELSQTKL